MQVFLISSYYRMKVLYANLHCGNKKVADSSLFWVYDKHLCCIVPKIYIPGYSGAPS